MECKFVSAMGQEFRRGPRCLCDHLQHKYRLENHTAECMFLMPSFLVVLGTCLQSQTIFLTITGTEMNSLSQRGFMLLAAEKIIVLCIYF